MGGVVAGGKREAVGVKWEWVGRIHTF